jgi:hypothetical protein
MSAVGNTNLLGRTTRTAITSRSHAVRKRSPSESKVSVEEFVRDFSVSGLVGEFYRLRAKPLHADHRHKAVRQDAPNGSIGRELFELAHESANLRGPEPKGV